MTKLGFLASHNGSNMQSIINACKSGALNASPSLIISNNSTSGAIQKAKSENIQYFHISSTQYPDQFQLDDAITSKLEEYKIDLVILAGYMKKLGDKTLSKYKNRILNIHPALLPEYGGRGFYGMNVHKAVIEAKEKFTGVTIHLVDGVYDHGKIISQVKIPVNETDDAETLAERVLEYEHKLYVETLIEIVEGKIDLDNL